MEINSGDFTHLAKHYVHRVGYSGMVLEALVKSLGINDDSVVVDVGAYYVGRERISGREL